MHHGQVCFSTERIIVLEPVAEKFCDLLKQKASTFVPGSGASASIVRKAYDNLVEAQAKGADFLVGGPKYVRSAELVPTIVQNVTEDMSLFDTESFGPSVSLYVAKDDKAAVKMANNSAYGLNVSVHTTNMQRAINIGRRLEFGQVHVNNLTTHNEGEISFRSVLPRSSSCESYAPYSLQLLTLFTSDFPHWWNQRQWVGSKQLAIRY